VDGCIAGFAPAWNRNMPEPASAPQGYWQHVEEIFHEALDVPAGERLLFLRERCKGDAGLEKDVREILDSYETQDRLTAQQATVSNAGTRFGAFEIVHKIGEGGMGVVYLARRCEDFDQFAAIKVINGSPAAAALMAERFRQERQILAGLEHPNIARLLDGGVTPAGQPYLVMEYVEGVRLDEYCESHHLSIAQRLELFRKICAAVHFAHQHLIVHRDLKPGNILVNQMGEPKLLDFGVARVLAEPGGSPDQTVTITSTLLLTPQYASPEQLQGLPCTVASDIYSLGVILYELLAGRRPYSKTASTPAELIAAIITQDAPRPSVLAPQNLKSTLRGDLDGIVVKALARQPKDRYGSVDQLSDDVHRYLEGLPVSAVEGSRLYIARKFVLRHRVAVVAAALVLLSLVAGLAGTIWQARVAERERAAAEQRFSDARKLANYLLFPLYDSVTALPGSLSVRADMAGQSLKYLDRLAAARSADRALTLELAEGYVRLATILQAPSGRGDSLGESAKAEESARKAVALLEPLNRGGNGDARIEQSLAHAESVLGNALCYRGKPDEGIPRLKQAAAILDELAHQGKPDPTKLEDAGRAYVGLMDVVATGGGLLRNASKDQVLAAGNTAIARFEAALAADPHDSAALLQIVRVYWTEGGVESPVDPAQGIATLNKGLAAFNRLPPDVQGSREGLIEEGRLDGALAWAENRGGQYAEALATLNRTGEIRSRMGAEDPNNATNLLRTVSFFDTRVSIEYNLHMWPAVGADLRKEIALWDRLIAIDPSKASNYQIRAACQGGLAKLLAAGGKMDQAIPYAKASIAYLTGVADRPDAPAPTLDDASYQMMATPVLSLRDYPRALRYAQRADALSNGKDYVAIIYLAEAYANVGDTAKALETVKRGLALVPGPAPGQHPSEPRADLEKEQTGIEMLIKTGHLPPDFND
jgi:tetratricopeptide (TPR) repeat protein